MAAFGADGRCLMRALQEELDDPDPQDCGRCAVCAGPRYDAPLDPALVRAAALLPALAPARAGGQEDGAGRDGRDAQDPRDVRAEEGRALARLGDGGWDPVVQAGLRAGRFDDELVGAAAEPVRAWRRRRSAGSPRCRRAAAASWCPTSRSGSPTRSACRSPPCSSASATARRSARWPTRPSRSPTCAAAFARAGRRCPAGPVPARRRRALQRLDAGDGRRPAPAPRRARGLSAGADQRVLALHAGRLVRGADGLGLRRAALAQVDAQHRHRADRQELRLPVLQRRSPRSRPSPGSRASVTVACWCSSWSAL